MSALAGVTAILTAWLAHVTELLLTLGWWMALGLVLCALVQWLLPSTFQPQRRSGAVLLGVFAGAFLPICNCGILPLAVGFHRRGWCMSAVTSFFLAATLLNPAALLTAYALLGPMLTGLYVLIALLCTVLTSYLAEWPEAARKSNHSPRLRFSESLQWSFCHLGPELSCWCLLGILLEGTILTAFPPSLFQSLLRMPETATPLQMAAMGLARYLCIPDDIPFAASLSAAGAPPAGTILFLLIGIVSNLPELVTLLGMLGKRIGCRLLIVPSLVGGVAAWVIHLLLDERFVPLMDLSAADGYLKTANMLSVGTWMPARYPCAVFLVIMGIFGARKLFRPFLQ